MFPLLRTTHRALSARSINRRNAVHAFQGLAPPRLGPSALPITSLRGQTFRRYTTGPSSSSQERFSIMLRQFTDATFKRNPAVTVIALVNTAVFLAFQDEERAKFMVKHFVRKEHDFEQGRWYTMLTCGFSHQDLNHFGSNMLALCGIGRLAVSILGNGGFLAAYVVFDAASSVASHFFATHISLQRHGTYSEYGSLGASGAVLGLLGFVSTIAPRIPLFVEFGLPLHNYLATAAFAVFDLIGVFQPDHNTDNGGHLGGMVIGILGAAAMRALRKK